MGLPNSINDRVLVWRSTLIDGHGLVHQVIESFEVTDEMVERAASALAEADGERIVCRYHREMAGAMLERALAAAFSTSRKPEEG